MSTKKKVVFCIDLKPAQRYIVCLYCLKVKTARSSSPSEVTRNTDVSSEGFQSEREDKFCL